MANIFSRIDDQAVGAQFLPGTPLAVLHYKTKCIASLDSRFAIHIQDQRVPPKQFWPARRMDQKE
jgi:hypothetical protein